MNCHEPLLILDSRGLIIRAASVANKENGITDSATGKVVANWKAGLSSFLTKELIPLLDTMPPRRMIAVWDDGNTYRTRIFPEYKALRKSARDVEPKEFSLERSKLLGKAKEFMAHLGVRHIRVPGEEADDVIALLCQKLSPRRQLLIKTVDADLLQLVSPAVSVIYQGQLYSEGDSYTHKVGNTVNILPTSLITLYKSIVGDTSDGYRGVSDLGPKAWAKLYDAYGIDGMQQLEQCAISGDMGAIEAAVKISGDKLLQALSDKREEFALSYQLAQLHPEICYGERVTDHGLHTIQKPAWDLRIPDAEKISWYLQTIGALDLFGKFEPFLPIRSLYTAENHQQLAEEMTRLTQAGAVAYDFEAYDKLQHAPYREAASNKNFVDVLSQSLTGISWCYGDNFQFVGYASCLHANTMNLPKDWMDYILSCISQVPTQIVQVASFELTVALRDLNKAMPAPMDTAIMASYVDENESAHLKDMARFWLHYDQQTYEEVTGGLAMNELSADHVLHYACDDSLVSAHLFDVFKIIMELEGSWDFYQREEILPVQESVRTHIAGTRIDFNLMKELQIEDEKKITEATDEIRKALESHAITKPAETWQAHAYILAMADWEAVKTKYLSRPKEKLIQEYETDRKNSPALPAVVSDEQLAAYLESKKWAAHWKACAENSVYTPYTEERQQHKFVPSAKQLTKVIASLGSNLELDTVSKTGISEFMFANEDAISANPRLQQFCELLGKAAVHLNPKKKRTGPDYEALESFCSVIMDSNGTEGVVIKHGTELNFGSQPQMMQFLYGMLGLPLRKRSKVDYGSFRDLNQLPGTPATGNKAALAALVYDVKEGDWRYPVLKSYLDINKAEQNISLYYKKYPLWASPEDGLIHPQIKNCGTITRRPSGTAPNVLQVSKKDDAKIRKCFVSWAEEYVYVCLDFNGQELRLTASESRDPVMMGAYLDTDHKGPHTVTACRLTPILLPRYGFGNLLDRGQEPTYEQFTAWYRGEGDGVTPELVAAVGDIRNKYAKATNFTVTYVGGPSTLAENLIIDMDLAEQIMASIHALYARIAPWQREVADFARAHGYVETAYGNRKHVSPAVYSDNSSIRGRAERQAVNMLAQGCAADILKVVRSECSRRRLYEKYSPKSTMPIYDELAACVPAAAAADYAMEMAEIMAVTPPGHPIPMEAELEIGVKSWGDKKAVKLDHAAITEFLYENKHAK